MCLGSVVFDAQQKSDTATVVQVLDISDALESGNFTTVDDTVVKHCFTNVWFSELATEDLYHGIASKAGNKDPRGKQVSCLHTIGLLLHSCDLTQTCIAFRSQQ